MGSEEITPPRPFLKWAGGKARLLPELVAVGPDDFGEYHEPFLGGGALFFALRAQGYEGPAHLTDSNDELVNTYQQVRDCATKLVEALGRLEAQYLQAGDRAAFYYAIRSDVPKPRRERAARLLFLNKTCFNGLFRVNQAGQFNVPHGRYASPRICDADNLRAASAALRDTRIEAGDFEDALRRVAPRDFVYLDPPYHPVSTTSSFTGYTSDDFGWDDQVRLADSAAEAASRGCLVLISNSAHPDIEKLYKEREFHTRAVRAPRSINSNGGRRGLVNELLASSYADSSRPKKNRSQVSRSSSSTTFPALSR